jgi:mannosyltransferase OCH1-like enzyme
MDIYDIIIPPFFYNNEEKTKIFFLNLFNTNNEQAKIILEEMREKCLKLIRSESQKNEKVNKLTHKIWLTDNKNGKIPNELMLYLLKRQYSELNDFKHYLWVNNEEIGKEILKLIDCPDLDIELRNINEFYNYKGRKVFDIFLKHKLFANACDIARIQIIHKYGGLYSDFGWAMTKNIPQYINNFDIMFNGETALCKGYISHNVIYSFNEKHIIFDKMVSYLEDKQFLIEFIKNKNGFCIIEIVSPRFIMAAIPGLCKNDKLITLVNHELTFSRQHNSSHQNGSFGSNTINTCMEIINNEIKEYINSL